MNWEGVRHNPAIAATIGIGEAKKVGDLSLVQPQVASRSALQERQDLR